MVTKLSITKHVLAGLVAIKYVSYFLKRYSPTFIGSPACTLAFIYFSTPCPQMLIQIYSVLWPRREQFESSRGSARYIERLTRVNCDGGIKPSRLSKKLSILGAILCIVILISSIVWLLTISRTTLSSITLSLSTTGYLLKT